MGIALPARDSLGVGLYSYADAARFIGGIVGTAPVAEGLPGPEAREAGSPPPLWKSQWADSEIDGIGFRDLIELRFVRTFVACGVPLNLVRRTIVELNERLGKELPSPARV
jgi:hypothetical protein